MITLIGHSAKASRSRGFTLIEVMLSILLLGILLAAAFGGVRAAVRGMEAGEHIIVEGIQKAQEGAPVTAMTAAQLAAIKSQTAPAKAASKK